MYWNMSLKVAFCSELFATSGTRKRIWSKFEKLQYKYFKIDQNLFYRFECLGVTIFSEIIPQGFI